MRRATWISLVVLAAHTLAGGTVDAAPLETPTALPLPPLIDLDLDLDSDDPLIQLDPDEPLIDLDPDDPVISIDPTITLDPVITIDPGVTIDPSDPSITDPIEDLTGGGTPPPPPPVIAPPPTAAPQPTGEPATPPVTAPPTTTAHQPPTGEPAAPPVTAAPREPAGDSAPPPATTTPSPAIDEPVVEPIADVEDPSPATDTRVVSGPSGALDAARGHLLQRMPSGGPADEIAATEAEEPAEPGPSKTPLPDGPDRDATPGTTGTEGNPEARDLDDEEPANGRLLPIVLPSTTASSNLLVGVALAVAIVAMIVGLGSAIRGRRHNQLADIAFTDGLTGLRNRRRMDADVMALREVGTGPTASLMIDVDHFKKFNDDHGHAVGDDVLRRVGDVLSREFRKTDVPYRYGGEEFCVLLPDTTEAEARAAGERVRRAIEAIELPVGQQITASIGVSIGPASNIDTTIDRADGALYVAKESGRNQVAFA